MAFRESTESLGRTTAACGRRVLYARDSSVAGTVRRYRSDELIGECPWIVIEHGNDEYRLRITRQGKLIMTK